jgi:hypothetical protein
MKTLNPVVSIRLRILLMVESGCELVLVESRPDLTCLTHIQIHTRWDCYLKDTGLPLRSN